MKLVLTAALALAATSSATLVDAAPPSHHVAERGRTEACMFGNTLFAQCNEDADCAHSSWGDFCVDGMCEGNPRATMLVKPEKE